MSDHGEQKAREVGKTIDLMAALKASLKRPHDQLAELLIEWGKADDQNPLLYDGDVEWAQELAKWLTARGVSVRPKP